MKLMRSSRDPLNSIDNRRKKPENQDNYSVIDLSASIIKMVDTPLNKDMQGMEIILKQSKNVLSE